MPQNMSYMQRCFLVHIEFNIFSSRLLELTLFIANFVHPTNLHHSIADSHFKGF